MSRAFRALSSRWTTLVVLATVAAMVLAVVSIVPAFGSPPHVECKETGVWNGDYWKQQFDNNQQPTGSPETNVAQDAIIIESVVDRKVTWTNNSSAAVFRIYQKNGRQGDVILNDLWQPEETSAFTVLESVSHVTFCFTNAPEIEITKLTNGEDASASDPHFIPVDDPITWTYQVENTGTVNLHTVSVTDDQLGTVSGPLSGDDGDGILEPGEIWVYEASGTSAAGQYVGGDDDGNPFNGYSNVGTVNAQSVDGDVPVSDSDGSGYYGSNPSIDLDVTRDPSGDLQENESFTWTFVVTNDGNVPLNDIEVQEKLGESYALISGCNGSTDLLPGETFTCTKTDTATAGNELFDFRAEGTFIDGTTEKVISEEVTGVEVTVNQSPTAIDDDYEMDERDQSGVLTHEEAAPGVLGNDSDPDGDSLSATSPTMPTNGGTVVLDADGSFTYTPSATYAWGESEPSRVDTFSYTADDGNGGTDTALVSITVVRKICEGDTVTGSDEFVSASITLLSATGCKDWVPVVAEDDNDPNDEVLQPTILFQPEDPDETAVYDGTLTREDVSVADGSLPNVELLWDPTPEESVETDYEPMPACAIDGDGNPILSGTDTTGWCFYDLEFDLVGDQLWDITWKVRGWDDPGFIF